MSKARNSGPAFHCDVGLPEISITFKEAAAATIAASDRGTAGMILLETEVEPKIYTLKTAADMPEGLSESNQEAIKRLFLGSDYTPLKGIVYVGTDVTEGLKAMKAQQFDWLCGPVACTTEQAAAIGDWVKSCWTDKDYKRAVLPDTAANFEGIVNLAAETFTAGGKTYDAAAYCSRIVGMICGLDSGRSLTYYRLEEVENVTAKTRASLDEAVDGGKLVAWHDGEKVKLGRGVTAYTGKDSYKKKIRLIDIICRIKTDLTREIEDNYIGQVANTYDNKILLVTEVKDYLTQLEQGGLLNEGSEADLDTEAQRKYLAAKGLDVSEMEENELLQMNTDSKVFIKCTVGLLDVIEDVAIEITI